MKDPTRPNGMLLLLLLEVHRTAILIIATQHQRIHFKFDDFVMAHAFDVAFQGIRLPCAAAQRVDGRQSGMNGVPAWRAQSKSN